MSKIQPLSPQAKSHSRERFKDSRKERTGLMNSTANKQRANPSTIYQTLQRGGRQMCTESFREKRAAVKVTHVRNMYVRGAPLRECSFSSFLLCLPIGRFNLVVSNLPVLKKKYTCRIQFSVLPFETGRNDLELATTFSAARWQAIYGGR